MDWHAVVGGVAALLAVLAIVPYIKDILHGTTRPNIFSWALWVLLLLLSALAQISAGPSWSLAFMLGDLIGTSLVLLLCFAGYGYGKYGSIEWICTALAIAAIAAWQLEHQPVLAIFFSAVADFMAAVPTLVKAYKDPWSEAPTQFFIISFAAALGVASSTLLNPANLLFPAYLFALNGSIGALVFFGRRFSAKLN